MEIDALMSEVDGQWTEVDLPDEEALLIRKLRLLEDFVRSGTVPCAMRIRYARLI
jgi:hypothetical protein